MHTRRLLCSLPQTGRREPPPPPPPQQELNGGGRGKKRRRASWACDYFDDLPDDLVVSIMCLLGEATELLGAAVLCKRFKRLSTTPLVLANASAKIIAAAATAGKWSESRHRFLSRCADAGNLEACYTLGMIRFYCLRNTSGASLMARAAMGSHAAALYSLAVIQFNGSGGTKGDKDLRAGAALCARAAFLGHVDAMRELGHCLQDGYGVRQNVAEGRRFLVQANARELAAADDPRGAHWRTHLAHVSVGGCPLLSDFGCAIPPPEAHVANRFLLEWFAARKKTEGLRMCSHGGCGRPETRRNEFRRCSVCGTVNYCSRACQALDWKLRHKAECLPAHPVIGHEEDEEEEEDDRLDGADDDLIEVERT